MNISPHVCVIFTVCVMWRRWIWKVGLNREEGFPSYESSQNTYVLNRSSEKQIWRIYCENQNEKAYSVIFSEGILPPTACTFKGWRRTRLDGSVWSLYVFKVRRIGLPQLLQLWTCGCGSLCRCLQSFHCAFGQDVKIYLAWEYSRSDFGNRRGFGLIFILKECCGDPFCRIFF